MRREGDDAFSRAILFAPFIQHKYKILAQCTVATPPHLDAPSSLLLCRNVRLSPQFLVHLLLIHTQTAYALELALGRMQLTETTYCSQSGWLLKYTDNW